VEGRRQYLFDETRRRHLDALGGFDTMSVGYAIQRLSLRRTGKARRSSNSTTIYLHPNIAQYAEKRRRKMPGDLKVLLLHQFRGE
jgi:alanine-glyoxylate transaminase / (R)-3-amino-2-methylpropionate-pyruvate transaminase